MRKLGILIVGFSLLACSGVAETPDLPEPGVVDTPDPVPERVGRKKGKNSKVSKGPTVGALARDRMDGGGCTLLLEGEAVFQEVGSGIWMNINGKDVKLEFVGGGRPKDETWSAGSAVVTATSWTEASSCAPDVQGCEGSVITAKFEVVSGEDATVFVAKGTCSA